MSAARTITDMGAAVALEDGKLKLSGLDRLTADVAERVLDVARKHREELVRELSGASAPGPETDATGLDWLPGPPGDADPSFDGWWAAYDLADVCCLYDVRIVHAGERFIAVYPPSLEPELIAYAGSLLAEAQPYLITHTNKLPILTQAEAVKILLDIMRQHKGIRFCRGDGGSRWPIYPRTFTAGQKATVQALWFAAGDALDRDDFKGVDEI